MYPSYTAVLSPIPLDGMVPSPAVPFTVTVADVAAAAAGMAVPTSVMAPVATPLNAKRIHRRERGESFTVPLQGFRLSVSVHNLAVQIGCIGVDGWRIAKGLRSV